MKIWENIKKRDALCLFFIYCAVLFALYAKYFFSDTMLAGGDAVQYWSDAYLLKNALLAGEFPLWNKFLSGGIPFNYFITPVFLLNFISYKAMGYISYILFLSLGATCFYQYLKKIECGKWASFCISVCYLLSIHIGGARKAHIHLIFTMVLLPVILYLIEQYFSTRKLRWLLGSSVVMALQFVTGYSQQVVYADIFLFVYLLAFGLHYRMKLVTMLKHGVLWGGTYFVLILWKVVPLMREISFHKEMGATGTSMEYFTVNSPHPIKLLMTVFPKIFGGNSDRPFGEYVSGENDLEMFLGQMIVVLVLFAAIFLWKNFRVRFALGTMLITFCYASLGNIPGLANLLYQVPLLNGFRVPSRILYIAYLSAFIIAAIALSRLKELDMFRKFKNWTLLFLGGCLAAVGLMMMTGVFLTGIVQGFDKVSVLTPLHHYFSTSLKRDCLIMLVCIAATVSVYLLRKKLDRWFQSVLCIVVAALTLAGTLPYSLVTYGSPASLCEELDPAAVALKAEMGNYKVWDAVLPADVASHFTNSMVGCNLATTREIPALKSYIPMNNQWLNRMLHNGETLQLNFTGSMIYDRHALQNLQLNNALLSMLGVKYVIDSSGLLADDQSTRSLTGAKEQTIFCETAVPLPYMNGEMALYQMPIALKADTYYRFDIDCTSSVSQPLYSDFWAENYDFPGQDCVFTLKTGKNHLSTIVNSEDIGIASGNIYARIFAPLTGEVSISAFQITEIDAVANENTYTYWGSTDDIPIYVNQNARDILYVPDRIESVSDYEDLYNQAVLYQLDRVNYSTVLPVGTLNASAVQISDIDFAYNDITATVKTPEDTVVNFSQCYFPAWKAYVDGVETEVHLVNGLIMGMEVPAGTHTIKFAYQPTEFYVSAAASGGFGVFLIGAWFVCVRRKKNTPSVIPTEHTAPVKEKEA